MACSRYYMLLDRVTKAGWEAMANSIQVANYPPYQDALQQVRAHSEVCDCIDEDFKRAFPELKTVKTRIVPYSEIGFFNP